MTKELENKKILMIIAAEKFRDEEFQVPYNYFIENGANVTVASTKTGNATGMFGASVSVDKTVDDVNEKEYNAVIFVGGAGVPTVRSNNRAVEIAHNAVNNDVLAAICWAPTILAKADVLKGKKATVWLGDDPEYGKKTSDVLEQYGARFIDEKVVVDHNIVTGNGPEAAQSFAEAITKRLMSTKLSPCTSAGAEHARMGNDDEPCDDGRGGNL